MHHAHPNHLRATHKNTVLAVSSAPPRTNLSIVIEENGELRISEQLNPNADVEAFFTDSMNATGWGVLEVKINVIKHAYAITDAQRMFAAGVAEGYLTSRGIFQTYSNIQNTSFWDFTDGPQPNLVAFLDEQQKFMDTQIAANPNEPFWQYAALLKQQLSGLHFGYNLSAPSHAVPTFTDSWPFVFLNLVGDLLDLISALSFVPDRFSDFSLRPNFGGQPQIPRSVWIGAITRPRSTCAYGCRAVGAAQW